VRKLPVVQWVASRTHPIDFRRDPLPLVMNEQGCLYRNRMIHAMEAAGRTWHMAYTAPISLASRPRSEGEVVGVW
jgi:hypothetical protein